MPGRYVPVQLLASYLLAERDMLLVILPGIARTSASDLHHDFYALVREVFLKIKNVRSDVPQPRDVSRSGVCFQEDIPLSSARLFIDENRLSFMFLL